MIKLLGFLAVISLGACQTFDSSERIGNKTVRVSHGPDGDVTRQFRLADGTGLNVVTQGAQATVKYVQGEPISQAEIAGYIRAATGCAPGAVIQRYNTSYNHATNIVYALNCAG